MTFKFELFKLYVSVLVLAVTGFQRNSGAASSLLLTIVLSLLYVASAS